MSRRSKYPLIPAKPIDEPFACLMQVRLDGLDGDLHYSRDFMIFKPLHIAKLTTTPHLVRQFLKRLT